MLTGLHYVSILVVEFPFVQLLVVDIKPSADFFDCACIASLDSRLLLVDGLSHLGQSARVQKT